jgi:glycine/D-amino acid oxidase-like deaminating enzyme
MTSLSASTVFNRNTDHNVRRNTTAEYRHHRYVCLSSSAINCSPFGTNTGGGIIGCTTAYFLTRHPSFSPSTHNVTILESQSIASGASGKSGGLLALWAYPSSIVPLSYKLHAELAEEHDGAKRWGYRALHCGSLTAKGKSYETTNTDAGKSEAPKEEWQKLPKTDSKMQAAAGAKSVPQDLDWFDADAVVGYSEMGNPATTAQVHPYLFTTSMADLAGEAGAKIILGSATALDYTGTHGVKSVTYEDKETRKIHTIQASDVILAAGPWTSHIFPDAPIAATRAHSVVIKADVSPYAIFSEIKLPEDFGKNRGGGAGRRGHVNTVCPELYARPDGTVYACGPYPTPITQVSWRPLI